MPRLSAAKVVLIALLTALLGFAGGYFFYANTVARYDTTSSVCVAMQEAVKANMLNTLEVKQIGTLAGSTLTTARWPASSALPRKACKARRNTRCAASF